MTLDGVGGTPRESARNLALMNYGLLFASFFFAGVPALVAVIIAYTQRDSAAEPGRSHFTFQIRCFWVSFVLALLAGICGLAAVIHVLASLYGVANTLGWDGFDKMEVVIGQVAIDASLLFMIVGAIALAFLSGLWLIGASVIGAIRLASDQGMGKSRTL
ncbi:hypothetical protein [Phenylobacterium sp.]|jgi:uncharacterized membrane protein|uniref:hypothetical protein n=1 Tax=Phenylobacterium sp. TaxID=1871053 RepID=UPI0040350ECA